LITTFPENVGLISGAYRQLRISTGGKVVNVEKSSPGAPTNCSTEREESKSEANATRIEPPFVVQPAPVHSTEAPAFVTREPELVRYTVLELVAGERRVQADETDTITLR
jgi:hypothetical protein